MIREFIGIENGKLSEPFFSGSVYSQKHWEAVIQNIDMKDITGADIYESFILEFDHVFARTVAEVVYNAPTFCLKIIESPIYRTSSVIQWETTLLNNPKIVGNKFEGYK